MNPLISKESFICYINQLSLTSRFRPISNQLKTVIDRITSIMVKTFHDHPLLTIGSMGAVVVAIPTVIYCKRKFLSSSASLNQNPSQSAFAPAFSRQQSVELNEEEIQTPSPVNTPPAFSRQQSLSQNKQRSLSISNNPQTLLNSADSRFFRKSNSLGDLNSLCKTFSTPHFSAEELKNDEDETLHHSLRTKNEFDSNRLSSQSRYFFPTTEKLNEHRPDNLNEKQNASSQESLNDHLRNHSTSFLNPNKLDNSPTDEEILLETLLAQQNPEKTSLTFMSSEESLNDLSNTALFPNQDNAVLKNPSHHSSIESLLSTEQKKINNQAVSQTTLFPNSSHSDEDSQEEDLISSNSFQETQPSQQTASEPNSEPKPPEKDSPPIAPSKKKSRPSLKKLTNFFRGNKKSEKSKKKNKK